MHSPACPSLKEHLSRCIAALDPGEAFNLRAFCEFAQMSWDTERLVSDPDLTWIYERERERAMA